MKSITEVMNILKTLKIHILLILTITFFIVSSLIIYNHVYDNGVENEEMSNDELNKEYVADYRNTKGGVGFVLNDPSKLQGDFDKANEIGLVFINAGYEGDGEIPPIIQLGFKLTDLPVPNMAGNANDPDGLKKAYLNLVREYNPVYIGLGNELERMPDIEAFIHVYNEVYTELKQECRECIIYPTFQYESFDMSLARRLEFDLLVLTSYPFAKYADLNQIPKDYYDDAFDLANELGVDLAFSEIGWTHLPPYLSGYPSAEDAQVAFYNHFRSIIERKDRGVEVEVKFVSWGLLYDAPQAGKEWAGMGLYSKDGIAKSKLINEIK